VSFFKNPQNLTEFHLLDGVAWVHQGILRKLKTKTLPHVNNFMSCQEKSAVSGKAAGR